MEQRKSPARVFVHESKRGTRHLLRDAEPARDAFDESGFSRAKIAKQRDHVAAMNSRPNRSPNLSVSSRLCVSMCCEVIITRGGERLVGAIPLDERDFVFGTHDTTDLGQFRAKSARPFLAERGHMPRIDCEEQLEVLAVAESAAARFPPGRARDRDLGGMNLECDPAWAGLPPGGCKSLDNPSLRSIMAWTGKCATSQRAS